MQRALLKLFVVKPKGNTLNFRCNKLTPQASFYIQLLRPIAPMSRYPQNPLGSSNFFIIYFSQPTAVLLFTLFLTDTIF